MVQRIGTADSATPYPDPCGGQAPALHFLIPPSTISLQFGTFRRRRAGMEGDWRAHPGSESGMCFRTNRSSRLAPAHQVMKSRSCGLVQRIGTADSATPYPDPCGGQAPALQSPLPTPLDSGLRRNDELGGRIGEGMPRMANERLPERSIPDRSPGHAFIAIAHAGWRRHTKV